jgi:AraC-like DNA-binding protein
MATRIGSGQTIPQPSQVILISAPERVASTPKVANAEVRWFASIDDFDRWRTNPADDRPSLEDAVRTLVAETSEGTAILSLQLTLVFAWLSRQEVIPTLKSLSTATCSRRSFFRQWAENMTITPSSFLTRLTLCHARSLLDRGATLSEVKLRAPLLSRSLESTLGDRH